MLKNAVSTLNEFFDAYESGAKRAEKALKKAFKDKSQKYDIELSVRGGKVAAENVRRVKTASQKAVQAASALNDTWKQTPSALKRQLRVLKGLRDNTLKFEKGTDKVTESWKKVSKKIDEVQHLQQTGALLVELPEWQNHRQAKFPEKRIHRQHLRRLQLHGFSGRLIRGSLPCFRKNGGFDFALRV